MAKQKSEDKATGKTVKKAEVKTSVAKSNPKPLAKKAVAPTPQAIKKPAEKTEIKGVKSEQATPAPANSFATSTIVPVTLKAMPAVNPTVNRPAAPIVPTGTVTPPTPPQLTNQGTQQQSTPPVVTRPTSGDPLLDMIELLCKNVEPILREHCASNRPLRVSDAEDWVKKSNLNAMVTSEKDATTGLYKLIIAIGPHKKIIDGLNLYV